MKNGSKGSRLYTRNGLEETMGIYPVEQVDATGAGDSYDAAFICGLAEGKSLKEAAQMLSLIHISPEVLDVRIQPDRLAQIKFIADVI